MLFFGIFFLQTKFKMDFNNAIKSPKSFMVKNLWFLLSRPKLPRTILKVRKSSWLNLWKMGKNDNVREFLRVFNYFFP